MTRPGAGGGVTLWVARRMRAAHGDERGVTLMELIVAMSIFAIVMTGLVIGFNGGFRLTRDNRQRSVAANLASQEMDSVRAQALQDFTSIPVGLVQTTQVVDGVSYTVRRRDRWLTNNPNAGPCDGASNQRLAEMGVRVSVTWPNMSGTKAVASQSVIVPPAGSYDLETGHIGVKVLDQTGAGVAAIPVLTTGPGGFSDTEVTQSDGCAFFGFLDPGTYTVKLSSAGYVTDQGVSNPSQAVAVTVGTITSLQFNYALASTLDLTMSGAFGGTVPTTVPVSVGNTNLLPNGTKVIAGSGNPRSVGSLYPFTAGYQVWAGGCLDADPQAQKVDGSGAYYPGATRASPIGVQPGLHSIGTLTMGTATITVTGSGNTTGLTVVATHAADAGCSGGTTLTLGVTDSSSKLTAAIPYGTWTITVSGKSPNPSWPVATVSPLDGGAKSVTAKIN